MRKEGYYWVKLPDDHVSEYSWIIAEYDGFYWQIVGSSSVYNDHYFESIDEKRLTHE